MDYIDNIDGTVTLDTCDNYDGENIIINVSDGTTGIGIALSADQVRDLANELLVLAEGV